MERKPVLSRNPIETGYDVTSGRQRSAIHLACGPQAPTAAGSGVYGCLLDHSREQVVVIEYLKAENRMLRERPKGRARCASTTGRGRFTPDTPLHWHRLGTAAG